MKLKKILNKQLSSYFFVNYNVNLIITNRNHFIYISYIRKNGTVISQKHLINNRRDNFLVQINLL